MQVMNPLFQPGGACKQYKQPKHTYDFMNKALSALKVHCKRVTVPDCHSSSKTQATIRTCQQLMKYLLGSTWNIKRFLIFRRHNNATIYWIRRMRTTLHNLWHRIHSHIPRSGDVIHNPLSAISIEASALVDDELSPKPHVGTKKQCFTSYDTIEVMVSFAATNQQSELAFWDYMRSKMETEKDKTAIEKQRFLMFLIKKKASGAISNE
jgi:hypothetical protein